MKLFIPAHVTLEYFNFKRENEFKRLLSTSIASAITAVELLQVLVNMPHQNTGLEYVDPLQKVHYP